MKGKSSTCTVFVVRSTGSTIATLLAFVIVPVPTNAVPGKIPIELAMAVTADVSALASK